MSAHRRVLISTPWDHHQPAALTAYVPDDAAEWPDAKPRAVVLISGGAFELHMRVTDADLRAVAAALLSVADEMAAIPVAEAVESDFGAFQEAAR